MKDLYSIKKENEAAEKKEREQQAPAADEQAVFNKTVVLLCTELANRILVLERAVASLIAKTPKGQKLVETMVAEQKDKN